MSLIYGQLLSQKYDTHTHTHECMHMHAHTHTHTCTHTDNVQLFVTEIAVRIYIKKVLKDRQLSVTTIKSA